MLAVVVYCYSTLQVPLVGYIAGKQSLGAYRSALMLVAGLDLLYSSINSLLLPRLVAWRRKGPTFLWHRQKELLFLFLFSGGAISAGVISLAPVVYRRFLGVAFTEAILPFQILVVGRLAVFVGQIFAWSLSALHLDRQFFLASLAGAVFSVGANLLFVPCYGIVAAAVVSVLSEIVVHGLCFISVKRYISRAIAIQPPTLYNMICRICDSSDLVPAIDLGLQPWCNHFLRRQEIGSEPFYPLRVVYCRNCGAAQLDFTVKKEVMFGDHTYLSGVTKSLGNTSAGSLARLTDGSFERLSRRAF